MLEPRALLIMSLALLACEQRPDAVRAEAEHQVSGTPEEPKQIYRGKRRENSDKYCTELRPFAHFDENTDGLGSKAEVLGCQPLSRPRQLSDEELWRLAKLRTPGGHEADALEAYMVVGSNQAKEELATLNEKVSETLTTLRAEGNPPELTESERSKLFISREQKEEHFYCCP